MRFVKINPMRKKREELEKLYEQEEIDIEDSIRE